MVADSGPILSFARANRLDIVRQIVGDLAIPDAVYEDMAVRGAGKPGSQEVQQASWIRRLSAQDRALVDRLPHKLHLGEREAIALAQERGTPLLVDEREARREAQRQGVAVVGSLWVLTQAKARVIIPRVKPVLDDLIAAGTYVSDTLYQTFLQQIGEP
jgi:predicted nucleic acid-binding protein